ncbi:hypothetical protein [Paraburkholderia youngii]|uniref:Phage tail protein n=1 Tax=Paraburkholderia youngii TaxID=2782701 RepID=A0A7W8P2B8_9BURK|nr:hypothetical protein [Paraburkholderia youngii]MBB5398908.1 hypothetical protein [Paraburkholderia youngii]NVI04012.1 hypothetical protein [Paraburkholderia youngii]
MNLHEQLGALEMGVDQLIQAVVATQAENTPETNADAAASPAAAEHAAHDTGAQAAAEHPASPAANAAAIDKPAAPQLQPTLEINRPARDEITMTIGNQTVALRPEQISRLIEELSNARASMTPEQPQGIPPGWQFVSTKNPMMAVQKQSSGDRLLVMRHTGHGWVPFTFSPDVVIQMYMMLTNA